MWTTCSLAIASVPSDLKPRKCCASFSCSRTNVESKASTSRKRASIAHTGSDACAAADASRLSNTDCMNAAACGVKRFWNADEVIVVPVSTQKNRCSDASPRAASLAKPSTSVQKNTSGGHLRRRSP